MAPIADLGLSPLCAGLVARAVGGDLVRDLLFHLPESYLERGPRITLRAARDRVGLYVTLAVRVVRHDAPARPRQPWRVTVADETGSAELTFFKPPRADLLVADRRWTVSGKAELFGERLVLPHPDYLLPEGGGGEVPEWDPVWPLTARLSHRMMADAQRRALKILPESPEWADVPLLRRERWPGFAEALRQVHAPTARPDPAARARLAYDELLAHQLAIAWVRNRTRERAGRPLTGDGALRAAALERFGYALTPGQSQALAEIDADLESPRRMLRLLQGDVGAGKTIVALLALLRAVEAGTQAALMAPTELLARQHHRVLQRLSPVPVGLLTGSVKGVARRNLLLALAAGRLPIVVGTHALFQEKVAYHDLGLAVIDEQHRFGVGQRLSLGGKGERTDILVMTATPIPRSLLLTQWGEMTCSRIPDKPAGRKPIVTSLHSLGTMDSVTDGIARAVAGGAQIYWVCPLVEENEALDLAAAEERFRVLQARFGERVGLAHGRQEIAAREATMRDFCEGRTRVLVATTVIEVGVDVPNATIMVVEHAERFGLAQLHQLRGRVGRSDRQSYCLLLHEGGLGQLGRRRLGLLRDSEDGFRIADEDFRMRGGGDLLGTRQSGLPGFRMADPEQDERLLRIAHRDAEVLLSGDPRLTGERGMAARLLLRLFDKRGALRTLESG